MIIFTIIQSIYMKDGSIAIQLENSDNYQAALKKIPSVPKRSYSINARQSCYRN